MKMFRNMPLGIFSGNTGLREKLRIASIGGFEGIDIDIGEAADLSEKYSTAYVKGMMDSFNIRAGAWFLPFALDSEEKVYGEGIKNLERYARVAKEISALRALAVVASADKAGESLIRKRLVSVAELLGAHGCSVGLDCPDCNVEVSGAGVVLNSRQWYLSGTGMQEMEKIDRNNIVYVRLGDTDAGKTGRFLPGETGIVDINGFLKALADIGYEGPVVPEMPDRNLITLPEELAARLLGGSLSSVWSTAFPKELQD